MISVIIPTFNEEVHIARAVMSAKKLSDDIWILDGGSSDNTISIAKELNVNVFESDLHFCERIIHFQELKKYKYDWLLRHDADELIDFELNSIIKYLKDDVSIIEFNREFFWKGKKVSYGGFQNQYVDRLWHFQRAKMEKVLIDERLLNISSNKKIRLEYSIKDMPIITFKKWWHKHRVYALNEARNSLRYKGDFSPKDKKYYYYKSPPVLRSIIYFFISFFIQRGFLDLHAWSFHFYRSLIYRILIDLRILLNKY
jgi:glycosyltransferase involved in cell wall biosynthesis